MYEALQHQMSVKKKGYPEKEDFPNHFAIMVLVCHRRDVLWHECLNIMAQYDGHDGNAGPFSYKEYLLYLLKHEMWGDRTVLYALSLAWECRITTMNALGLQEICICHDMPLEDTNFILPFNSAGHYSGCGKSMTLSIPIR